MREYFGIFLGFGWGRGGEERRGGAEGGRSGRGAEAEVQKGKAETDAFVLYLDSDRPIPLYTTFEEVRMVAVYLEEVLQEEEDEEEKTRRS